MCAHAEMLKANPRSLVRFSFFSIYSQTMYRDKNARFAFELAENANCFHYVYYKKRKKNGTKVGSKVLMPRIKWMKMDLVQLRVLSWSVHFGWGFRSIVQNKRDKKKKLKCYTIYPNNAIGWCYCERDCSSACVRVSSSPAISMIMTLKTVSSQLENVQFNLNIETMSFYDLIYCVLTIICHQMV